MGNIRILCRSTVLVAVWNGFSALATVYQSDGSAASVQGLHNAALNGDTITIPAGTFTWTTPVTITKGITIQGAGNDQTVVIDNFPRTGQVYFIQATTVPGQLVRVTGIRFTGQGGSTQPADNGALRFGGNGLVRIDHCHFDHLHNGTNVGIYGPIFGVADHNVMDNFGIQGFSFMIWMRGYGGADYGDGAYADVAGFGGPKFFVIEDNTIKGIPNGNNLIAGDVDAFYGAKYVFRHNQVYDAITLGHSTGSTDPRGRGVRAIEIYDNDFYMTNPVSYDGTTGGSILAHDNRFHGAMPERGFGLNVYRAFWSYGAPFYGADGTSPWDQNDPHGIYDSGSFTSTSYPKLTDSTKNWTPNQWVGYAITRTSDRAMGLIQSNTSNTITVASWQTINFAAGQQYQIHRVLTVMDQPGRGKGDLIDVNNPRWPNQQPEPCYQWNNVHVDTGQHINFSRGTGAVTIQQGRDYFDNTPMPGYTPYVYPHPLVTGSPVPSPTPSATPTATPVPTPTPTPSATPTATATATPRHTPKPRPSRAPQEG